MEVGEGCDLMVTFAQPSRGWLRLCLGSPNCRQDHITDTDAPHCTALHQNYSFLVRQRYTCTVSALHLTITIGETQVCDCSVGHLYSYSQGDTTSQSPLASTLPPSLSHSSLSGFGPLHGSNEAQCRPAHRPHPSVASLRMCPGILPFQIASLSSSC